jgi:hypothetical protein
MCIIRIPPDPLVLVLEHPQGPLYHKGTASARFGGAGLNGLARWCTFSAYSVCPALFGRKGIEFVALEGDGDWTGAFIDVGVKVAFKPDVHFDWVLEHMGEDLAVEVRLGE